MAKFSGLVGFAVETETTPGVWTDVTDERTYYGDVIRLSKNTKSVGQVNDDISINNRISIVADPFANDNFFDIAYVEWNGILWTVTSVEVQRPRLILSLGGVYHGK